MTDIFLATLGQRPEAITIAFDLLSERIAFGHMAIIHTDAQHSGIAQAHTRLRRVLERDYPAVKLKWHEVRRHDGTALLDIDTQMAAENYYRAVFEVLRAYKLEDFTLHLMVAGGRKAMSIYAALAAALVFGGRDHLWTVLSPAAVIEERDLFHLRPGMRDYVQVVEMPILPARLPFGELPADPQPMLERRKNPRADFLSRLTREEGRLVEVLMQNPYADNEQLAATLHKSPRTVENQFRSIYDKMTGFFDLGESMRRKRQALIDLLLDRL